MSAGGVARNVAENLARLGVPTRCISAIGDDVFGQMLIGDSDRAGVDTEFVFRMTDAPTPIYMSILDQHGEMQLAVSDTSAIAMLGPDQLDACRSAIEDSVLTIVDTNLSADALDWIGAAKLHGPIFADTVSVAKAPQLRPLLSRVHTLKTGVDEAAALVEMPATLDQLEPLAARLHELGVKRVYVTRGREGVYCSTGNVQGIYGLADADLGVRNTSGAGDAFLAGLAYAWVAQLPQNETLQFALHAAALAVAHTSTINPNISVAAIEDLMMQTTNGR